MYVTRIPNRDSPPAVLLRESYREGGKVKSRTLANISDWPEAKIDSLRRVLAGEALVPLGAERFEIDRALAHGHVAAALGTVRRLGLDKMLPKGPDRPAKLILAMIAARIIEPAAKLATARQLSEATAAHSLGAVLGLSEVDEDELYAALDLLGRSQASVEKVLAERHLKDGVLVLYDVTSSYLEGRRCELAQFGYSRDHRGDRPQIVFGLLCTPDGRPVAVEAFEGNLGDPTTLAHQVKKLRMRFRLKRIVLVGDRGMITNARIDADLKPAGFDWITALRAPAIKALAAEGGPLQLSLFDERDMAEIVSDDYPGERLIVRRNPELAAERSRKRAELLDATETALVKIRAMTEKKRNPLRGRDKIALKVGAVIDRRHMAKHFDLAITETGLAWSRKAEAIAAEAALDGVYVIRSSLPGDGFGAADLVLAYKGLSHAERGFRDIKSGDLDIRPIHHRRAHRVRAHVFLCMLAYYVVWHMKRDLAPMLFKDDDPAAAAAERSSPVAKAKVSPAARRKAISRRTEDGQPVHSFRTLMQDLANLTRSSVRFGDARPTTLLSRPTPIQTRAFSLLGLKIAA
ncbi:MAG TPA: IS1634 family transposase [Xanthobacteraceae bacterium]|nr:IS1634 family transposase [Xanthobacteraceae bacterium]